MLADSCLCNPEPLGLRIGTVGTRTTAKQPLSKECLIRDSGARTEISVELGFSCVAMETENQNFHLFELDSRFQEKYRNTAMAIFFVA
jgi:hypothetical protein